MRQIVLEKPGEFRDDRADSPRPAAGEALVRVRTIGVCGTDLHAFAGRQPFLEYPPILGHELGVEVLEVHGGDHGIKPGDRCAVEPYLSCGRCHACRLGKPNCCESLQVLGVHTDGGIRGILAVPIDRLHRSRTLTLDQLALVETLGIGAHAVTRSGLQSGESVLVVGAGPIGLAVVQFAKAASGRVRVLEMSAERRAFAERFGVEALAGPPPELSEVVFDATGSPAAMEASFNLVAHGGRLVFVGLVRDRISFEDPLFHRREMTLYATRNSCNDFPRIMQMIDAGLIDTRPWVTHRMALADVPSDFAGLRTTPGLIKAMIDVSDADL